MTARPLARRKAVAPGQLHETVRETMRAHFLHLQQRGKAKASAPEEFYGFRAEDVTDIHFHKQGFGRGVWYRLQDGRVIDCLGKPSEPDRAWYESSAH